VLGLQRSSRQWLPPPLHCQAAGALSQVALATQAPLHLRFDKASSSTAELAATCDMPYEAAGAPSWVALATHLDPVYIVQTVACYATNPGHAHWDTAKQTDRYLAGTLDLWLAHGETTRTPMGYAEADGSTTEDRCATLGHAPLINTNTVPWAFERQETALLSTTKCKHTAPTHGSKAAGWLHGLLPRTSSFTTAFLIDRGDIPWASKCQEMVAPSTFLH
jgi:hypothetical protein